MSRADQLAFAATIEALTDAGLYPLPERFKEDMGVIIGGGSGGLFEAENFYADLLVKGPDRSRFSRLSTVYCASSADRIASNLGLLGPKTTLMTACSSGANALGYARDLIESGQAGIVLAGAVEPMCRITYAAFNALSLIVKDTCDLDMNLYRQWLDSLGGSWAKCEKINSYLHQGKLDTVIQLLDSTALQIGGEHDSISFSSFKNYLVDMIDWLT